MKLFSHQEDGVAWLKQQRRGLLCDDPGLGKTATALGAITKFPVCIICPPSLVRNWEQEIAKWLEHMPHLQNQHIDIFKYSQFSRGSVARATPYETYILDESHYVKSAKSKRTQNIKQFVSTDPNVDVFMLTATPIVREIDDIVAQLQILGVDISLWKFRSQLMYSKVRRIRGRKVTEYSGCRDYDKFVGLLKQFAIRRRKTDHLDLPAKLRANRYVSYEGKLKQQLDDLEDWLSHHEIEDSAPRHIMTARRELGVAKVWGSLEYIKTLLESTSHNYPLLIFAHHREVVDTIHHELLQAGYYGARIAGDTKLQDRAEAVEVFQSGQLRFIVANIHSGGVGLTLTRSSHVIFAELDWTPANLIQAEDRVYRIGQTEVVNVDYLLADHPVEQSIMRRLEHKMEILEQTVETL
jgi:SWI/SNF-related matrix-associated actin-dependent regulator 1 of chromatin subfamily A